MEDDVARARKDRLMLWMFQRQVLTQSEYVLFAYEQIVSQEDDNVSVFFWIQSLLSASANISKCLWGERRRQLEKQREPLRVSLGIGDDSPLKSMLMRNNFDHLDERLDEWRRVGGAFYADQIVGLYRDLASATEASIFRA